MSTLLPNQVRVRLVSVSDYDDDALDRFTSTFSEDELARVVRLQTEQLRTEYIVTHGVLRDLLGGYLGVEPASVVYWRERHEKPVLLSPPDTGIDFSLSHSNGKILYALATGRKVGVDIEKIDPSRCDVATATRIFTHQEMREWRALPEEQRVQGFFRGWVRKEALVKAVGVGMALGLKSFSVTIDPRKPAAVMLPPDRATEQWNLHPLKIGSEFIGAVAVEGTGYELFMR